MEAIKIKCERERLEGAGGAAAAAQEPCVSPGPWVPAGAGSGQADGAARVRHTQGTAGTGNDPPGLIRKLRLTHSCGALMRCRRYSEDSENTFFLIYFSYLNTI